MRNTDLLDNAPIFYDIESGLLRKDYINLLYQGDGNGLNILLQNYWMVIHPPVLFLGFASTLIPFAFVIGGLWTRRYTEWTKAALPWALFSTATLGLGIMMGAAWAYESLNFGGYWAWDPVENAVLVPWLILIAGVHTLVIYRHTGNALRTTNLFFILTFLFILYSTYLTRSGDLQDTSVHAFTGEGITVWHLRIFLLVLAIPSIALLIKRYKYIPHIVKEEETSSREFWMFVGSLVLFLSSVIIIIMTSIPVFNKVIGLFSSNEKTFNPFAMGEESEHYYNQIQIFVAIILGLFTGFGMYLKYKITPKQFLRKLILPVLAGAVAATLILAFGDINYTKHGIGYQAAIWVAVTAAAYSLVANSIYIFTGVKGRIRNAGGAIAHVGFAMMLLGILISSSKKEVVSLNRGGIPAYFGEGSKENPGENITLVKGLKTDMGKYWVTYNRDSVDPRKSTKRFYILDFESKDGKEKFTLQPNAFVNEKGQRGLSANPDARHYLTHDIFLYITSLPDPDQKEDTTSFKPVNMKLGDTTFYSRGFAVLDSLWTRTDIPTVDSVTVATFKITARTNSIYNIKTYLINQDGISYPQPDTLQPENLILQLQKAEGNGIELGVKESDSLMEFVTLKAYKFPWINLVWAGTIILVIGTFISMFKRMEQKKLSNREIRRKISQAETIS
jgi:cytochrome c-type biogenesis protein CcmF